MIIDKLDKITTEKERAKLKTYEIKTRAIISLIMDRGTDGERYNPEWPETKALDDVGQKQKALQDEILSRYFKRFSRRKKGIYEDAEEILKAATQEDFKESREIYTRMEELSTGDLKERMKEEARENYDNCFTFFVNDVLDAQFEAAEHFGLDTYKLKQMIDKRVSEWYKNPHPRNFKVAATKSTSNFPFIVNAPKRDLEIDPITKETKLTREEITYIAKSPDLLPSSVDTDKLLNYALKVFTESTDLNHKTDKELERLYNTKIAPEDEYRTVAFPLKEYAIRTNHDVTVHETNTPEEAKKEKERAKYQMKAVKSRIDKSITALQLGVAQREKNGDTSHYSFITSGRIKNGWVILSFTPEFIRALESNIRITYYPEALLPLGSGGHNHENAYMLGRKIADYANMERNIKNGTADRIKVKNLLKCTRLISYEELEKGKNSGHWRDRIKEPFEKALDELSTEHPVLGTRLLSDWYYAHEKGRKLTDEEADIPDYRTFEELYLRFTLADPVDHSARLEAIEESKKRQRAKKENDAKRMAAKSAKKAEEAAQKAEEAAAIGVCYYPKMQKRGGPMT